MEAEEGKAYGTEGYQVKQLVDFLEQEGLI